MMSFDLEGPAASTLEAPGRAHVWCVGLAVSDETLASLRRTLSDDERARADRFVFDRDRRAFVASHGALREILARYTRRDPAGLRFQEGARGKPWLCEETRGLEFNLSHSGEFALIGVTRGMPIGVDVETLRPLADMRSLSRHCFAPAEVLELESLAPDRRVAGFFNAWTRKEAYIKAIGDGLSCPLDSFEVTLAPGQQARLRTINGSADEAARWSMHAFVPAPGLVAAAVIGEQGATVRRGWCVEAHRVQVAT